MRVDEVCERLWPGRETRVERLGGGLTNHNFKVTVGTEAFVVRVGGQDTDLLGIDRRAEHGAALVAAEVGVGPEVIAFVEPEGCLVTRFVEGAPVPADELAAPAAIPRVAAALRAVHDGPPVPGRFDSFRVVEEYRETVLARGGRVPGAYPRAQAVARRIEDALGPREERPCHNDLLNANFIADGDRLWIVDWEYAGMGDPFFDLANFSVNNGLDEAGDEALLSAYLADADADDATTRDSPSCASCPTSARRCGAPSRRPCPPSTSTSSPTRTSTSSGSRRRPRARASAPRSTP